MHLYFKHAQRKVYKMCTRHNFYILSEPRHRLPWPIKHHSIIWKGNQTMRCSKEVKRERGASWNVSSVQSLFHLKRAFLKFNTNNSGFWSTEFISLNHKLCLHCIVKERSAKYVYWTSAGEKKERKEYKENVLKWKSMMSLAFSLFFAVFNKKMEFWSNHPHSCADRIHT